LQVKWALNQSEELDLPFISRLKRERRNSMMRGKEVALKVEK